jgi:LysM repeat protein
MADDERRPDDRYSLRRALPWVVGSAIVLALAVIAGFTTAYLIATLRAVPPPQAVVRPTPSPAATPRSSPLPSPAATAPVPAPTPTREPEPSPEPEATPLVHIVEAGESLSVIAARYGVTLDAIVQLNELRNPNLIVPGQRILIPPPEPEET